MNKRSAWVLVLAVVTFAACDLSTEGDTGGTFDATVTGAISSEMEGTAIFFSSANGEFSLSMTDPADGEAVAVAGLGGKPGVGTTSIEHHDSETGFIAAYAREDAPQGNFSSVDGEIVITSSTSTRLQGTVTFEAIGFRADDPETEVTVDVVANFDARCVPTGGSPCN